MYMVRGLPVCHASRQMARRDTPPCPSVPKWHDTHGDVRTISDTLYHAAVDRLYCSGLIQPSDSFGLSSL